MDQIIDIIYKLCYNDNLYNNTSKFNILQRLKLYYIIYKLKKKFNSFNVFQISNALYTILLQFVINNKSDLVNQKFIISNRSIQFISIQNELFDHILDCNIVFHVNNQSFDIDTLYMQSKSIKYSYSTNTYHTNDINKLWNTETLPMIINLYNNILNDIIKVSNL